jgi:hypothetical protein
MGELIAILKNANSRIQKDTNHVMMVSETINFKRKSEGASMTDTPGKCASVTSSTFDVN